MNIESVLHFPQFPLNQWVESIWIFKCRNEPKKLRLVPNGAIELYLNFGDSQKTLNTSATKPKDDCKNYWVHGFQHSFINILPGKDTRQVIIRFLSGGAYSFFKFPMSEISDTVVEADWLRKELEALRNKINDCKSNQTIIQIIEKYLLKKFDNEYVVNESVKYVAHQILVSLTNVKVSELVRKAGYSHKHFISLFKNQLGTTPKGLQRIARFQKFIKSTPFDAGVKLNDMLYNFSYHDSSHLAHDFRDLTGMTPNQYLECRTFDANCCYIR